MIASGLTDKFWGRAIFYEADISNIKYRPDLKCLLMNLFMVTNQTGVSVTPSASNVGSMCQQISVRIENSMIGGASDLLWEIYYG